MFISYASEDRKIARRLKKELEGRGLTVWFAETMLVAGQSLRRSIDRGLAHSRAGVVILSPSFFGKEWPQAELDGLMTREKKEPGILIPVWHKVDAAKVGEYSFALADKFALKSSDGVPAVADQIERALKLLATSADATRRETAPKAAPRRQDVGGAVSMDAGWAEHDQLLRLRIEAMPADHFEQLVYELVRRDEPSAQRIGAPDGGADVLRPADGHRRAKVWQAKHYTRTIYWDKCEASLDAAIRRWDPEEVVFVFALDLSARAEASFTSRLVARSSDTDTRVPAPWTLSELVRRLHEHSDLRQRFFGTPKVRRTPRAWVLAMVMVALVIGGAVWQLGPVGDSRHSADALFPEFDPRPTWRIEQRSSGGLTQIRGITARDIPAEAEVELRCGGTDCEGTTRRFLPNGAPEVRLATELLRILRGRNRFPITLHPGTKIEIRVTKLLFTGEGLLIETHRRGPPTYRRFCIGQEKAECRP